MVKHKYMKTYTPLVLLDFVELGIEQYCSLYKKLAILRVGATNIYGSNQRVNGCGTYNVPYTFGQWHISDMCTVTGVETWFETQLKQKYIWTDHCQMEILQWNERVLTLYANIS